MITDVLTYTLHIAPSLAIMLILLVWQNQRINQMEQRIENMLESCMQKLLGLIDEDGQ